MSDLIDSLIACLGKEQVLLDERVGERYHSDWSSAIGCAPSAVLRPKSTQQLSEVMALCHEHHQPVVIQGGLTGLAGGATPVSGEIAISLERMSGIEDIDPTGMTMVAHAGTPLQVLQDAALEHNLFLPLDLGARGSCHIGGNVATNAGGTEVIRYGMTRSLVLGLEAVLADGTVVNAMNRLIKNNSGYDLKQLFIGSEGTLGVITRVVLKLQPKPLSYHTALCGFSDYDSVVEALNRLKSSLGSGLTGFELMWDNYYHRVLETASDLASPLQQSHRFYVLLEFRDSQAAAGSERFESALFELLEDEKMDDAVIAQSHQEAANFWRIRDGVAELLQCLGPLSNQDISLPISKIGEFTDVLQARLKRDYDNMEVLLFGHLGDNNIHALAYTGRQCDVEPINSQIMHMIGEFGGAITAEHGVGVLKKKYLPLSRSASEIDLMKTLKSAMDPRNILNPGRVI